MNRKNLLLRILFDFFGVAINASLSYFAFLIVLEISELSQWERIIGFIVLLVASGFIVGFFAFKRDGIFISGAVGLSFLILLTVYGIKGIGLYETTESYGLSLVLSIVEGIIFFCIPVLSAFLGGLLTPTLWQFSKREIHELKDAKVSQDTPNELKPKLYCQACGSEIPRNSNSCIICGKKV